MTTLTVEQSVIDLTLQMEKKSKFAYVNIPKNAVSALGKSGEYSFPNHFAKNVISTIRNKNNNVMKAVSHTLTNDISLGKYEKLGLLKNSKYYYSNVFEYYFMNNRDVYNTLIQRYMKNSSNIIITFHDKKIINKIFGNNINVVNVAYNNYYDKVDDIYSQISEFDGGIDYCIMDCGPLSLALTSKIIDNLNVSVIDFGKTISMQRSHMIAAASQYEKK